jgi:hypothetical protein
VLTTVIPPVPPIVRVAPLGLTDPLKVWLVIRLPEMIATDVPADEHFPVATTVQVPSNALELPLRCVCRRGISSLLIDCAHAAEAKAITSAALSNDDLICQAFMRAPCHFRLPTDGRAPRLDRVLRIAGRPSVHRPAWQLRQSECVQDRKRLKRASRSCVGG